MVAPRIATVKSLNLKWDCHLAIRSTMESGLPMVIPVKANRGQISKHSEFQYQLFYIVTMFAVLYLFDARQT
jgi:hypothetical protein